METTVTVAELSELRKMVEGQSTGPQAFDDKVVIAKGLGVFGHAAPAAQPAAIATVAGGANIDAEARTAINALLAVMRANGMIAT